MLSDRKIEELAIIKDMIKPFIGEQRGDGIISYGVSSYGYDMRIGDRVKVFVDDENSNYTDAIDPKNFDPNCVRDLEVFSDESSGDFVILPPHSFALASSVETFKIPRDILCVCLGKSTYARCGIIVNVTPFEPNFEGTITIELSNTTPRPCRVYLNEGIAQVIFFKSKYPCNVAYNERRGKYQNQKGIMFPKVLRSGSI